MSKAKRQAVTRASLRRLAESLGATIDIDPAGPTGKGIDLDAWAPDGMTWVESGTHSLVVCDYTSAADGLFAMWRHMSEGVEKCSIEECPVCEREMGK